MKYLLIILLIFASISAQKVSNVTSSPNTAAVPTKPVPKLAPKPIPKPAPVVEPAPEQVELKGFVIGSTLSKVQKDSLSKVFIEQYDDYEFYDSAYTMKSTLGGYKGKLYVYVDHKERIWGLSFETDPTLSYEDVVQLGQAISVKYEMEYVPDYNEYKGWTSIESVRLGYEVQANAMRTLHIFYLNIVDPDIYANCMSYKEEVREREERERILRESAPLINDL